jgi:hypothetical protein
MRNDTCINFSFLEKKHAFLVKDSLMAIKQAFILKLEFLLTIKTVLDKFPSPSRRIDRK